MDCAHFDTLLDSYLDRRLGNGELTSCEKHLVDCSACHEIVTAQQEARALLSTAVTETVTPVDVSGIWKNVEASLEGEFSTATAPVSEPALSALGKRVFGGIRGRLAMPTWRPAVWGGALATAAIALFLLSPQEEQSRVSPVVSRSAGVLDARMSESSEAGSITPASNSNYSSAPARVAALEAASGHTVATWVQPRTNARVIWVASSENFGVTRAGY